VVTWRPGAAGSNGKSAELDSYDKHSKKRDGVEKEKELGEKKLSGARNSSKGRRSVQGAPALQGCSPPAPRKTEWTTAGKREIDVKRCCARTARGGSEIGLGGTTKLGGHARRAGETP